jgi:hypothetical protein
MVRQKNEKMMQKNLLCMLEAQRKIPIQQPLILSQQPLIQIQASQT